MAGGTYSLLIELDASADIEVGALGERSVPAGAYAYVGSALGSGGFARVDRHRRVAAGENDARHWHVDYLLGHPRTRIADVVTSSGLDAECAIATRILEAATTEIPLDGFGASDCDCPAHLVHADSADELREVVERAHAAAST